MSDRENPFVLLARITVKKGMVEEYLEIAEAVEKTEEDMLFHSFDRDPDGQHKFVWTEVYRKSDDFLFHAELATHFSIEIYGNVSKEIIEIINSRDIPLKHFATTSVGYVRSERFS